MNFMKKMYVMIICFVVMLSSITIIPIKSNSNNVTYSDLETFYVDILKEGERSSLFNDNWKFNLNDVSNAYETTFNDASWQSVTLPHDYSITQDYTVNGEAESGFLLGGVGWYRKSFVVPQKYEGKQIFIEFDGVYMDSTIYVNGEEVGAHPYGYTPFAFNVTDYLVCDGITNNVIAVRVNHEIPSSRWYSGSGIYRDVYITVCDPIHVAYEGTKIIADVDDLKAGGTVNTAITTSLVNESNESTNIIVRNTLANVTVETSVEISANSTLDVEQELNITDYQLWSVDNPKMYVMTTEIIKDSEVIDTYETDYGFRYFDFVRETGFSLNGENMKLKGVCMHHDQGALGSVANYAATYRQMKIMKDMGCNAIRVTHNPASSVLLDICDELGLLVIEEAFDGWRVYKNGNTKDYSRFWDVEIDVENNEIIGGEASMTWPEFDIKAMVNRGKNHPSIIMWSLGNEVFEGATGSETEAQAYYLIARDLISWVQEIDTTRPVTEGDNRLSDATHTSEAWKIANEIVNAGGIFGTNYRSDSRFDAVYEANPSWIMYGSEFASAIHTRGWYSTIGIDYTNLQCGDYDNDSNKVGWGASASTSWKHVITRDYNAGEFVWTGFDYLGEPTVWNETTPGSVSGQGAIPNSSFFGIVDTAGFEKDTYYLYQSLWNDEINTVHLIPHWNGDEIAKDANGNINVCVYTDAYKVELYVNGSLFGTKTASEHVTDAGYTYQTFDSDAFYPSWSVPYEAGNIYVKAYDKQGVEITDYDGKSSINTASEAFGFDVTLWNDKVVADGRDLLYVEVDIVDANGNIVPTASNNVTFSVEGEGTLVGVDSGNASDLVGRKGNSKKALSGKVLAIVQTTNKAGRINVTMEANGLQSKTISIESQATTTNESAGMLSYELSKHVYVLKNSEFTLPTTITANMSDGSQKEVEVNWNVFDEQLLATTNVFTVDGVIKEENIAIQMTVHVLDEIAVMKSYAESIAKDNLPTLPKTMPIVYYDGTYGEHLPIVWESVTTSDFAEAKLVKVKGYATMFNQQYETTAYINVLDIQAKENIAASTYEDAPTFTNGYLNNGVATDPTTTAISDSLTCLNNDITNNVSDTSQRWTNWALRNSNPWTYIQMEWSENHTIGSLELWHFVDNAASQVPTNSGIYFEAYNNETNSWEKVSESHITIVDYLSGSTPYGFVEPVTTNKLRIWMQASASGKCIGLTEVKVYNYVEAITPTSTLTIENITLDDQEIGFENDVTTYNYEITTGYYPEIAVETLEYNKAITILPVRNSQQIVIVESEDESVMQQFTFIYKEPKVNKSELKALIDQESNYQASDYTSDSYANYSIVLRKAKIVLNDLEANQDEVDSMILLLQEAMNQLTLNTTSGDDLINTEDNESVTVSDFSSECDATLEKTGIGTAQSSLDKKQETFWHSNWENALYMPQYVTYDLGQSYKIREILFLPRQDGTNGDIFEVNIYVGDNLTHLSFINTFAFEHNTNTYYDRDWKSIDLSNDIVKGRYIKFEVTSAGGDQLDQYCSMSEIEFYGNLLVDKTSLLQQITKGNEIDETLFTKKAIQDLTLNLKAAQLIYDDEQASQEEVDIMSSLLQEQLSSLNTKQIVVYNGGVSKEGYLFAGYYEDEACLIPTTKTENVYSKFVDEAVLDIKAQLSLNTTGYKNIRFVSTVDHLDYQEVGFVVTIGNNQKTIGTTTVYNSIISNEHGLEVVNDPTVCSFASNYFFTFTLTNIPESAYESNIELQTYWITYDGTIVYGSIRNISVNELNQ